MSDQRKKRIRNIIKKIRQQQMRQAKQVEIVCSNMVAAHTEFANTVDGLCFMSQLYESLIGCSSIEQVFEASCRSFKTVISDLNAAFFLTNSGSFDYHFRNNNSDVATSKFQIESCITASLAEQLSESNKVCRLDDMMSFAVQENLSILKGLEIVSVPLRRIGPTVGFMLLYRDKDKPFSAKQLKMFASVSSGIARAVSALSLELKTDEIR